jgi:hypothetical protein
MDREICEICDLSCRKRNNIYIQSGGQLFALNRRRYVVEDEGRIFEILKFYPATNSSEAAPPSITAKIHQ